MATMELQLQQFSSPELQDLARGLANLAAKVPEDPSVIKEISLGFLELSSVARRQGKLKLCMASRALASILDGLDRGPEDDAPFILDSILIFLDNLAAPSEWRSGRVGA